MIRVSKRVAVVGVAATTVVGVGLFHAMASADAANYRTAKAEQGSVEQTVSYDGTIAASRRSDLTFATSGTVTKVAVGSGDEVEAGDTLAKLDATDLATAVTKAKAELADAQAYLDDVEDGQIDTVTRAAGGGGSASAASAASTSTDAGNVVAAVHTVSTSTAKQAVATTVAATSDELTAQLAQLADQQDAVTSAQSDATAAIAAAKDALAAQKKACADEDTTDADASDASSGLSEECQIALQAVQDAQDVVAQEQDALQTALETLGSTLNDAVAQVEKDSASSGSGSGTGSGAGQSGTGQSGTGQSGNSQGGAPSGSGSGAASGGAAGGSGSTGSSGTTATAADLASAQADVDTAKSALASAKADLQAATLTAPFDGTIMAVDVAAGDEASTSDTAFVLIGEGDTTATLSVPVDDLSAVKVGQQATVTPGTGDPVDAEVTAIGLVPESSDEQSSSTTYRVTVRVDGDIATPEGAGVSVALVTATAADVVTVPTTAVTRRTATAGTVLVVKDGEATRTQVTLGAMGGARIAVTEGLTSGQEVVIADLDAALPSSDSSSTTRSFGGGMGGAGGFSGGGRGGPPSR